MSLTSAGLRICKTVGFTIALPALASADVHVSPERPMEGQTITFTTTEGPEVEGSGTATYAPGTLVSRTEPFVDSHPAVGLQWTPDRPGLWELSWGDTTKTVVVGRRSIPVSGLLVLLVAASSLVGLSVWGLLRKS
ncbi:MAG: hypothetical protein KGO50_11475 [Myxococcales bacterium]|nr:hypothetical protein [Myxococcales bacterium]